MTDQWVENLLREPITVTFTGMKGTLAYPNVPLTINLPELHHLLSTGDVVVMAKKIRPVLIESLSTLNKQSDPQFAASPEKDPES